MAKAINLKLSDIVEFELYKIIHNKWMILSLVALVVLAAAPFLYLGYEYSELLKIPGSYTNPFTQAVYLLFSFYNMMLPFIIAIICSQYFLIEKQSDGFKLYQTIPFKKKSILLIKYLVLLALITLVILSVYLLFMVGIKVCELFFPLMAFDQFDMRAPLAVFFSKLLLLSYCIAILQYGLNNITNSYIIPTIVPILLLYIYFDTNFLNIYFKDGYIRQIADGFKLWTTHYTAIDALIFVVPIIVFGVNLICLNIQSLINSLKKQR